MRGAHACECTLLRVRVAFSLRSRPFLSRPIFRFLLFTPFNLFNLFNPFNHFNPFNPSRP